MELLDIMKNRRSVRNYINVPIETEKLNQILQAGLFSASGKGLRPWEFIVVMNKETLEKLSECRDGSAKMLAGAGAAIVVIGDAEKTDTWIEDCSIAMANMHLIADSLGLGSCWIQGRMRRASDGRTTEEYVREILGFPEKYKLQAILSLGKIEKHPEGYSLDVLHELLDQKIHKERY